MAIEVKIQRKRNTFELNIDFKSDSKRIGILGASGCGKSMTLKSIAGIEPPESGLIKIEGKTVYDSENKVNLKPQKRNIGYLFQNYALFPTMTVEKNIAAGLKGKKQENAKRVREMIEKFQLTGLEKRFPAELSGGQQQRVALARIMAYKPDVILLDEPFSALDMYLKDRLQQELQELFEDYEGTVIMVSHSRDEVYRFSEELLIIDQGQIVAAGKTKELFQNPQRKDIGYRAHDFVPVWGGCGKNQIPFRLESKAALPFEDNYYLKPANEEADPPVISWFVQRENQEKIREKGMPDALELVEEEVLFLE